MPTKKGEPKKPVVYERTELSIKEHALYATIYVRDADKQLWKFRAASFYFDLEKVWP